jgi:hypothetical protein
LISNKRNIKNDAGNKVQLNTNVKLFRGTPVPSADFLSNHLNSASCCAIPTSTSLWPPTPAKNKPKLLIPTGSGSLQANYLIIGTILIRLTPASYLIAINRSVAGLMTSWMRSDA